MFTSIAVSGNACVTTTKWLIAHCNLEVIPTPVILLKLVTPTIASTGHCNLVLLW